MPQIYASLTVDLNAIVANYRLLKERHAAHHVAAVVKADAYGLGMIPVARRLSQEGCHTFFVATLEEALTLRTAMPDATIYVFQGIGKGEADEFIGQAIRPVLNSMEQVAWWREAVRDKTAHAALHVDTGMCRLGLDGREVGQIDDPEQLVQDCQLVLLMSHLACASTPEHPLNEEQLALFNEVRSVFPMLATSFANSAGHFLAEGFHGDMGRPGCSLYGISPNTSLPNPMQHVVTLKGPILQLRHITQEQPVGYGATAMARPGMVLATVGLGYADGIHRIAGGEGLHGYIGEHKVPLMGRISMDMTCYDVSDVPESLLADEPYVTLIGAQQGVDTVAEICHTIGYEVFTRLGARVKRVYV